MQPQIEGLRTADIVVATPGRMLDHIRHRTSNLSKVKILVLDEADKMLEMGFIDDVRAIMSHLPQERQSLLFGATIPSELMGLIRRHLKNPNFVREEIYVDKNLLRQSYYNLKQQDKFSLLVHLLKHKTSGLAIVFCATRKRVDFLSRNLAKNGIHVRAVHGGLSQSKRFYAVESLKKEKTDVLVATDVAARGLDINNITHIYNYDSAKNSTEYIHRIGRTARAGKSGEAITILSERDHDNFRNVVSDRSLNIRKGELPCFDRISMPREEERFRGRRHDNRGRDSSGSRFRGAAGGRRGGFRPRRH